MVNRDIAFFFLLFRKKVRLPRTVVSKVLTGKCHSTDLSQASRIQIRANGSGCLTRDTKDIANEDQQDSPCPLTRQHVIRSNYMAKSIEAKKKVHTESWLIELNCSLGRANYNFRIKYLMQDHVWALHAYKARIVSSLAVPFGVSRFYEIVGSGASVGKTRCLAVHAKPQDVYQRFVRLY